MTHSQLLCSILVLLSLSPFCSNGQPHFRWHNYLRQQVVQAYGDSTRYAYRRMQVWCESADNPRATSDYGGWKKAGLDTVSAIKAGKGAVGLSQFIWATAQRYGAASVSTSAASDTSYRPEIYNPYWSLRSMCQYMRHIERFLLTFSSPQARRRLKSSLLFTELTATASYNAGEGRLRRLLKKHSDWKDIRSHLPSETRIYAEKIVAGVN